MIGRVAELRQDVIDNGVTNDAGFGTRATEERYM